MKRCFHLSLFNYLIKAGAWLVEAKYLKFLLKILTSGIILVRKFLYQGLGDFYSRLSEVIDKRLRVSLASGESHPLSLVLRPWFEHRYVRGVFGAKLVVGLFIFGVIGSPIAADFHSDLLASAEEVSLVETPQASPITTERRYQMPVDLIGVSQEFYGYHPGVDLRAPLGSDVVPITEGVVSEVSYGRWGYGQAILIEHASGYASMYAHVGRIFVEPGSQVDKKTAIAQVGMTGYTTGPHLHLEIYKDGVAVNPKNLIAY